MILSVRKSHRRRAEARSIIALGRTGGDGQGHPVVRHRDAGRVRPARHAGVHLHPRRHAEEAQRAAQLPDRRAPALFLRADGRVLPAVLLRRRPRRDALQPRHARLGVSPREERGRHHRLRLDLRPAPAGRAHLRQPPVPGARGGAAAHPFARARRGLLQAALRGALDRQHQRHELRGDFRACRPIPVQRRQRGGLLARHRRGRALPAPRRGRLRHHHADRHGEVRRQGCAGEFIS